MHPASPPPLGKEGDICGGVCCNGVCLGQCYGICEEGLRCVNGSGVDVQMHDVPGTECFLGIGNCKRFHNISGMNKIRAGNLMHYMVEVDNFRFHKYFIVSLKQITPLSLIFCDK